MDGYFAVLKTKRYAVNSSEGACKLPRLPPHNYIMSACPASFGIQMREINESCGRNKTGEFCFPDEALLEWRFKLERSFNSFGSKSWVF
jgi:hypothetical protein